MATYEYDSQNEELKRIAGGTLYADLPIGFVLPSFEDIAPVGFLKLTDTEANRTVSRTTYKELFDWATAKGLIGTGKPFGAGDGSTTFVLPDGREIAFKGIGENSSGASHVKTGGLAVGEFVDDRIQWDNSDNVHHNPLATNYSHFGGQGSWDFEKDDVPNVRTGDTTEVKALGCHYYIKAKNVGVPADFIKEVSKLNSYSTDEINTGKTWIDGKPIYRKVVSGLSVTAPADVFTTVVQIENVSTIINSEFIDNSNGLRYPVVTLKSGSNIQFYTGPYTVIVSTVILEYTKTTD